MNQTKLPFYFFFTIIFCVFFAGKHHDAVAAVNYTVENVLIEATGDNATDARSAAIAQGESQAFSLLLQQLNMAKVTLSSEKISRMVQGFEVTDEKISARHYQAFLTVSFSPASVNALLQQSKNGVATPPSLPTLILPVLKQGENNVLWEENPWQDAVATAIQAGQGRAFRLPLGDLNDMGHLEAENALAIDFPHVRMLAVKYGAGKVIVAQVTPFADNVTGKQTLDMMLVTLSNEGKTQQLLHINATEGETLASLLKRAAQMIVIPPEKNTQEVIVPAFGSKQIELSASFTTLDEWLQIQKSLVPQGRLQKTSITRLSSREAMVDVYFQGDKAALREFLAQKGIIAQKKGEGLFISFQ